MLYSEVTLGDMVDRFERMGRGNQFSRGALSELFDYYTDLSEQTGGDIELDVIAICCSWTEYESDKELWEYYRAEPFVEGESDFAACLEQVRDEHQFIEFTDPDSGDARYLVGE